MSSVQPPAVSLSLIAAIDENRLLATAKGIPWKLPRDVAHFRSYTKDRWLLLGRRTYEEMAGWFSPGHTPLVLTSATNWQPETGRAVHSVAEALALAQAGGATELVCMGGGRTFEMAIPHATVLILTHVHALFEPGSSPVYFPAWDLIQWRKGHVKHCRADKENPWTFEIVRWERAPLTFSGFE